MAVATEDHAVTGFGIRYGTTRIVLLTPRWAIKLPLVSSRGHGWLWSLAHGVIANLSELRLSHEPGVCPVVWSLHGLIQVYPRCRPVSLDTGPIAFDMLASERVPVDPRPHNVGVLNGRVVWLDYADAGECVACGRLTAPRYPNM